MRYHMREMEQRLAIGAARHGVVTTARARAVGADHDDLEALRWRGVLVSVARGVDRFRDHPLDLACRCQAALDIAGDGAALGLRTAGRLHGLYRYRASPEVEVITERGRDHRTTIGRLVQTRSLPPSHIDVIDDFPVTTIARTFFDLCGDPDRGLRYSSPIHEQRMIQVYNDALARRGLSFVAEAAVLAVQATRGRRGTTMVRRLLRRFGPDYTPNRSDVETIFFELCHARGMPQPEKQAVVTGSRGFIGVVDFLWTNARVVVEVDSSWHDGPLDRAADVERDALLRAAGYTVLRFRFGDIVLEADRVIRELGAVLPDYSG